MFHVRMSKEFTFWAGCGSSSEMLCLLSVIQGHFFFHIPKMWYAEYTLFIRTSIFGMKPSMFSIFQELQAFFVLILFF